MADNVRTIPWIQYLQYLKYHKQSIKSFVSLFNNKSLTQQQVEVALPKAFVELHKQLTNLLESHKIAVHQKDKENPKIEFIAKTVIKLQNEFIMSNKKNKQVSMKQLIEEIKPEIEAHYGD